ncbi:SulP family inorganic anion transporter [Brevibacillus humidisoli]|uniref:SulP family inorganic anion transporter n=1 Tax=Brevibacillus humidisoli TaxID=2895522 RepID=UPI001E3CEDBA|nr:SulP family inorganic anion transporter [Brevibacillus humidisoli]UFJ41070.1 SulP family inorganic anion transporter [Brevibacillus humidisoli]
MYKNLHQELLSGITVAVVALPLALAFGVAATGSPEGAIVGLYGAIFTGFFAALFGGTPAQVTGPTGPITVVITAVIAEYGLAYALVATVLAGLFQILFGLLRLGDYIRFIPQPVISGFMNGIAIIIIMTQMQTIESGLLIVIITIMIMLLSSRYIKVIPGSLVALLAGTGLVLLLGPYLPQTSFSLPFLGELHLLKQIELIGPIPTGLPQLHLPGWEPEILIQLISPAITIAVLGSIDSLLTSVVMDNITGRKHNSNKELIGQGIGNAISGLFGGLAGAGATVRSVVNVKSGGRTAVSAMVHSVILLLFMLVLGSFVSEIPLAVLAGILVVTGVSMFDYESLRVLRSEPKSDAAAMLITMVLTVMVDLMVAVGVGVVLSSLLFMKRMSEEGVSITRESVEANEEITLFSLRGPLYFGSCSRLTDEVTKVDSRFVILDMSDVSVIDASGALALGQISGKVREKESTLILTGVKENVRARLEKMKVLEKIGSEYVFESWDKGVHFVEEKCAVRPSTGFAGLY